MANYVVNTKGVAIPLVRTNLGNDVIDYIQPGEIYLWEHGWNGNGEGGLYTQGVIIWRNKLQVHGWVNEKDTDSCMTPIRNLGTSIQNINGKSCGMFTVRKDTPYYDTNGSKLGTLTPGSFVAIAGGAAGKVMPSLVYCDFTGDLQDVFINIGAQGGSRITNCNIKGKLG